MACESEGASESRGRSGRVSIATEVGDEEDGSDLDGFVSTIEIYVGIFYALSLSLRFAEDESSKLYIVYMGDVRSPDIQDYSQTAATESHLSLLHSVLGSHKAAEESLVHSYWKSFNGFAAWLSSSHVQYLSNTDGVVSMFESKNAQLLTSRSWDFVGLPLIQQTNDLEYQSDVIVGVLDTGVWPESESFDDAGLGPIPSKWRGACQTTPDFKACNKKIIGSKYYYKGLESQPDAGEFISPRDSNGHGTHTSSIAAGSIVRNASLFGLAQGDVRGGVPGARIAIYKVCWSDSCSDVDLLAAFDDAIYDGVDVISVSIGHGGPFLPLDYFEDSIAIGAFHAMKRGILTSNGACNDAIEGSVCNFSPWSLTVAASTIDRQFKSQLTLGNQMSFEGHAINTFTMEQPWYPLVYGGDAANVSVGFSSDDSRGCGLYSLDRGIVEGKIVLCYLDPLHWTDGGVYVSGGAGTIILYDDSNDTAVSFMIPATVISTEHEKIFRMILAADGPSKIKVSETKSVAGNDLPAPIIASFSSKGPSKITPDLLKPDITAPGVDILAAWSKAAPMSTDFLDKRKVDFNIVSGTSMACPHATGAAAYVKSFHPDWSPAAIKSALMTTASTLDATLDGNEAAELGYGAGQINPLKAINPGLVYDADANSYINMLCSQGYSETSLRLLTGEFISCSSSLSKNGVWELNYPSLMVISDASEPIFAQFPRTVTNVGPAKSTYQVKIEVPFGMNVTVEPKTLTFTSSNQMKSYNVKIESRIVPDDYALLSGALTWSHGNYSVRSPILVYYNVKK
ncbi:cucumisin-like [Cryptomeria japonica]|uniref:cucumisin-like n=1 Tax=Cryptomeria japonica TaxID=3369 RepID=UPI0027DA6138|nr:cucumisin-like [Cryptomeria japonica]